MKLFTTIMLAFGIILISNIGAEARPYHHGYAYNYNRLDRYNSGHNYYRPRHYRRTYRRRPARNYRHRTTYRHQRTYRHRTHHRRGNWAKPRKWCGWYMRKLLGVADPAYNRARHWLTWGRRSGPRIGAVVVWPHHVGIIVGRSGGRWIVKSGNDGNRVRTRPRSLRGAIGFRVG